MHATMSTTIEVIETSMITRVLFGVFTSSGRGSGNGSGGGIFSKCYDDSCHTCNYERNISVSTSYLFVRNLTTGKVTSKRPNVTTSSESFGSRVNTTGLLVSES